MKIRLAAALQKDSIVDGVGIRTVIWTQGCSHNCPFCHNPQTHDFKGGELVDVKDVIDELKTLTGQDGITFSGGDPMFQPKPCTLIAKEAHKLGLTVWAYTGFTFEELLKSSDDVKEFLSNVDVLIDGRFEIDKKSLDLEFRGSSNQRILDVKKSLQQKKAILLATNKVEHEIEKETIYI